MESKPNNTAKQRRSRRKEGPALVFVDTVESFLTGRPSADARSIIRHQAAKSGCRNRKRAQDTQSNATTDKSTPLEIAAAAAASAPTTPSPASLVLPPSPHGYEAMRVKFNFDITCLTSFTDIDLAVNACSLLQQHPRSAGSLLQSWPSCFLTYLPSRYGATPFLDDAMHCVAARAAYMMGSSPSPLLHTALYSKALASLAAAVTAQPPALISDIYCATRLLVLYESLGPPNQNAVIFHSNAGIDLIKQMGPSSRMSAFEQVLIRSQGPYAVMRAIYRKEPSLFETREWQTFFARAARDEPDADAQLLWKLIGAISFLPGILKDIQALSGQAAPPCGSSEYRDRSTDILERTRRIYRAFQDGHLFYQHRPPQPASLLDLPLAAESPGRIRLRGVFFCSLIYFCRVQATFAPDAGERAANEAEAQTLAGQALRITRQTQGRDPVLAWHLEERNNLARSVVRTRDEWGPDREGEMGSREELSGYLLRRLRIWLDTWAEESLAVEERIRAFSYGAGG